LPELSALELARAGNVVSAFAASQRDAMGVLLLDLHGDGVTLANVFWGLWLLPFGLLVMKSATIPRVLGVLLIVDGGTSVVVSATALLLPQNLDIVSRYALIPELGELWMMAWLLVRGARISTVEDEPLT